MYADGVHPNALGNQHIAEYIFVAMICKDNKDCAVVTHGFYMHTLLRQMKKAGFRINTSSIEYKNGECIIAEK